MLLSYCVYQKVFSAAVSKNKKAHFFMGTNVESRYIQSDSSSKLWQMSFSMYLDKTEHTGRSKCMKMSFPFVCLAIF